MYLVTRGRLSEKMVAALKGSALRRVWKEVVEPKDLHVTAGRRLALAARRKHLAALGSTAQQDLGMCYRPPEDAARRISGAWLSGILDSGLPVMDR